QQLDWSESLKTMQREWIGRSDGAEIDFDVQGHAGTRIRAFTTRADTLFGASFLVLAPEHPLVARITAPAPPRAGDDYGRAAAAEETGGAPGRAVRPPPGFPPPGPGGRACRSGSPTT